MGNPFLHRFSELERAIAAMPTLEQFFESGVSTAKYFECLFPTVELILKFDGEVNGDVLELQHGLFEYLAAVAALSKEEEPGKRYLFALWAAESANQFAAAYQLGRKAVRAEEDFEIEQRTERAAEGRRQIGDASRERVRLAAESFRHMTKDSAAPEIADSVGLSAGRVRKYLAVLYPGDEWQPKGDGSSDMS